MDPYHHSSQSSAHFDFNIDPALNLLDNEHEIDNEGECPSIQQQNINTMHSDTPDPGTACSMGMPTETSDAIVRSKTSIVWRLFDKDDANDKATCKICKAVYAHKKGGGTGTLDRHMKRSHKDWYENLLKQQQIQTTGGRVVGNFQFDHKKNRTGFAKMIVKTKLPFSFGENPDYEEYMHESCQPAFKRIPRTTLKSDIIHIYKEMKECLITIFDSCDWKFALTCDSWKACTHESYLCITCHWIDHDWILQKRTIYFRLFEHPHSGPNIARMITQACREYRIFNKIISISLDNASNNDAAMKTLKNTMNPMLDGILFHTRCACHILNLIVKEAYNYVHETINIIRHVVLFIKTSTSRLQNFKALCREQGLSFKKFRLDCETRWNSTFDMFESVIPFQNQLIEFCSSNNFPYQLTTHHFANCITLSSFLLTFKEATELLSGSYYPTTHHILPTLAKIAHIFKEYSNHDDHGPFMRGMFEKYKKYYEDIPILYCMALCLDPRVKMDGFHSIIDYLYETLDFDESTILNQNRATDIKNKTAKALSEMYNLYEFESSYSTSSQINTIGGEGSSSSQFQPPRRSTSSISSSSSSFNPWGIMKRQRRTTTTYNEMAIYEMQPIVEDESQSFDICGWWKDHVKEYPILSKMAHDLLTPPVSTVPSESVFSESARTIDERRARLAPHTLEMLMCTMSWLRAEKRMANSWIVDEDSDEEWGEPSS